MQDKKQCDLWAEQIANELIFNESITQQKKTIFVNKISDFLFDEKQDYTEFQHRKILKHCVDVYQQGKGDGLLEYMAMANNVTKQNTLEDKKQNLSGSQLKAQWKREFLSMSFNDQVDKATGWLTCGCPESSVPKFVMDWVRGLEDESLVKVMRLNFKEGRAKWNKLTGVSDIAKGLDV
jgi:hypothetical protein